MILHFVYAGDPHDDKLIAAPNTITRVLFDFFKGKGITVRHYVPDDTTTEPDVADTDVVIGHPHPNRSTIIWKLFESKCAKKYLLWPFHTQIPQLNRYAKGLAVLADKLFLISGPYWTDTLARTEYTEWASKIVRVDNAVDGLIFTPRKKRFNPPGKHGLFVFGRSGVEKGTEQLFELLKKTDYPVVVAGHYEQNDLRIISGRPNTKILGHIDWLNEEQTKCIFEICDFAVGMPISDASPTTLLESMAVGLVPITTPQCGYYYPSFLLLSLKDMEHNLLTLKHAQSMSEEELELLQKQNRVLIEQQHNWQRFCDTIWEHIGGNFGIRNEGRTGSKSVPQPGQRAQGHTIGRAKNLKVAEDYVNDGMKVDTHSSFGERIKELFARITPQKIIETGTYLGTGTTTIIANALRELGIRDTVFCTIEVNPEYYAKAKKYFHENNIEVYALNGLSVPRSMLPSREEIASKTITGVEYDGIFVDHHEKNRAEFYYKETDFPNVPDNLLYKSLEVFDFKPDFVLLDSAGHMGSIEFDYLIEHLKGECYIALDDVYHIKHHCDFQKMQSDERFEIIVHSNEKFGFCIARFDPAGRKTSVEGALPTRKRVLIVRPDSIGDFVLFAGTLKYFKRLYKDTELHLVVQEHIAELAQTCPDIDRCITFNAKMMEADKGYADKIISQLKEQKYDVAIHPVYSRTSLGDYLTLESGAAKKIALDGDCSNLPEAVKLRNDAYYTRLVPTCKEWMLETKRSEELLRSLGIGPDEPVTPKVWLTEDDDESAKQLLSGLKVKDPIIVCPFGQHEIRHWPDYNWAQLLSKYKGHPILICGAENNRKEADRIIRMSGHPRAFNLCGKTGLRRLAALLTKAKLCIGVESAAGHMAAAVGCPHVVIIGGGHFGRFMPYSPLSMLVYLPTKCYRCNWLCPRKFKQSYCITQIRVETVDKALRQALRKPKDKWTEPVLVEETVNRDFLSQQPLEIEPWAVADVDLRKVEEDKKYLLTAVVSTYKAERHIEGCLENLESQTIADRLEIIVIDSGSPQNEGEIVKRLQKKYDNIKYIRTEKRETIYKAWNRGIKQASGKYITNANTDDRMCEDALEYMVRTLEKYPDIALVYCDQDWVDEIGGNVVQEYLTPEFSRIRLLSGDCYISSNPVWRRGLHGEFGYFEDDTLCVSGDWEFWLRVSQKYDCMRVKSKFGLRRFAPDCNSVAHTESRTGLTHLDIAVIYRCYHYASQYGLSVGSRGVSGHKLFSNWPQTRLMKEKTKARFENRKLDPDDYVEMVQSFNCDTNPRLSIIITVSPKSKAESQRLLKTLELLKEQSCCDFELIVVNSAQTAYKPAKLAEKFGYPLVWINLISDFGPSFARNIALDEARGEYVAFIEQGSLVDKDFVQHICNHFERHKDIYALRGKVFPLNEEYASFAPDYADLGNETVRTLCEDGANCAFRKADIVEAGGFDDDLFYREFVELSYRLFVLRDRRLDGIMYVPDVIVSRDYSFSVGERFLGSVDQQIADVTLIHKWPGPEIHFYMDLMRRPYGLCRMKFTDDVDWMVALGNALEGKWPEASLIWVERALQASPDDAMVNYLQGSIFLKLQRTSQAQNSLEKTLGLIGKKLRNGFAGQTPGSHISPASYMKLYGWSCIKLADCYVKMKEFGKLKTVYEHLLRLRNLELSSEFREKAEVVLAKLGNVAAAPVPGISIEVDLTPGDRANRSAVSLKSGKNTLPASSRRSQYLVTAIISTYNSQRFLQGCLADLENQTIADKLEIIVVNSASEQDEEAIVKEFKKRYGNIVYIKTDKREGLYSAWNRAVKVASGLFLTSANTDDRHRKDALEIMTDALLASPDVALVYGDQIVTDTPNPTFENHHVVEMAKRAEFSKQRLLFGCCVGSQPMWRKSLHDEFGGFDEMLNCAADWDFWLKVAGKYSFKHIPEFLGLYYHNESGIEHGRKIHSLYERYAVGRRYGNPFISVIPLHQAKGNPLVSVVMAAYNSADYIARAIESVLIQNYRNFELIVVDDGSTDGTADIVQGFKGEPIKYFFKENGGVASARNFGLQKACGSFIVMLDSDDMMTPDYIARHLQGFEQHPEADMVYCDDCLIDDQDKPIRVINRPEYSDPKAFISDLFRCGFPVVHFKTCIRRSVFDKIGLYDERLIVAEDYDMMRRFVKQNLRMHHLPAALYLRRLATSSLSRNFNAAKAKSHFDVVRRFAETFTAEQLFPDVHWDKLPAEQKPLLAKCKAALVYLGIGQQYLASNAPDFAEAAFEMACAQLDECCEIEPANQQVRNLREKCLSIRAARLPVGHRNVCQPV